MSSGQGGSVIDFVMLYDGVSFREAVELLQNKSPSLYKSAAPVKVSTVPKLPSPIDLTTASANPADAQGLFKQVLEYYAQRLAKNPAAIDYLKKRGLYCEEANLTSVGEDYFISMGPRDYRIRGLQKNASLEVLKVNLRLICAERFYLDTLDFYRAKDREAFIRAAAAETLLEPDLIKRDLGQLLLALEQAQEQRIQAALQPQKVTTEMAAKEEKAALQWLQRYLDEVRPQLQLSLKESHLFLSSYGEAFNPDVLSRKVAQYIRQADIGRGGSCHLFRHTCATHMLENGADIRFIQQLLGHEKLETTQIYTEVSIRQLQEVHARTHPAKLK
jgi:integrase/recombinase XerD